MVLTATTKSETYPRTILNWKPTQEEYRKIRFTAMETKLDLPSCISKVEAELLSSVWVRSKDFHEDSQLRWRRKGDAFYIKTMPGWKTVNRSSEEYVDVECVGEASDAGE